MFELRECVSGERFDDALENSREVLKVIEHLRFGHKLEALVMATAMVLEDNDCDYMEAERRLRETINEVFNPEHRKLIERCFEAH